MNILAIETSCDETSVAIVRDGRHILANAIASQIPLHQKYGGVVPELASRQHVLTIIPVLEEALTRANLTWVNIDAIAVTRGPGLSPALLVGLNAAKGIAFARHKPLIAVNHIEGHVYSNWLIPEADEAAGIRRAEPLLPALCLVVSGGHTELILMSGHGQYKLLGKTVDDAAGEAFDKAARILGLGYPGGPAIQKAAEGGNPDGFSFPRSTLKGTYDFSFSGLKTALLRKVQEYGVAASKPLPWQRNPETPQADLNSQEPSAETQENKGEEYTAPRPGSVLTHKSSDFSSYTIEPPQSEPTATPPPQAHVAHLGEPEQSHHNTGVLRDAELPASDLAASFQAAVVDALIGKTLAAAAEYRVREVLVAGGVAANSLLREKLDECLTIPFRFPPLALCTDNAAMIAAAAYYRYADSVQHDFSLDIEPNARFV